MPRKLPLLLVLVLLAPPGGAEAGGSCGDVNSDGLTNVVDALTIARGEPLLCPPSAQVLASGQTTSSVAGDDGALGRGVPLAYVDNGDGTISDLSTGLTWEKKLRLDGSPDPASLHDADNLHPWWGACSLAGTACGADADCPGAETCDAGDGQTAPPDGLTAFEWVEALNAQAFAGHTDWRLPNVRELQSILDYERVEPSVNPAFHGAGCGAECSESGDPLCSCTGSLTYWTSTSYALFPDSAWLVVFNDGFVGTSDKALGFTVRAVRGP